MTWVRRETSIVGFLSQWAEVQRLWEHAAMTNRRGRGLVAVARIRFLFTWEAADDISMALPGIYKFYWFIAPKQLHWTHACSRVEATEVFMYSPVACFDNSNIDYNASIIWGLTVRMWFICRNGSKGSCFWGYERIWGLTVRMWFICRNGSKGFCFWGYDCGADALVQVLLDTHISVAPVELFILKVDGFYGRLGLSFQLI